LKRDPHVGVKMSNEEQPLALVVVGNATTEGRIRSIMKHQGWRTEFCGDGDKAVDEYVRQIFLNAAGKRLKTPDFGPVRLPLYG
jgi:hypothetical protein